MSALATALDPVSSAFEPTPASHREQAPAVRERFQRLYARSILLQVEELGRRFDTDAGPVTALDRISFRAHKREFVCFIGSSGCGKSTLIRILAGLDQPTSGRVLLDGHEVHGPGRDRGMVFQGYTLFPWRTVLENVTFGLELGGQTRKAAEAEAREWIELVGLARFAQAYPHQLSGGMKQRVAIARALANHPRILLMDEPFGALDAQTRGQMQSYLLQIWRQVDITVLFVTHDLDEAIYLADRIVVLGPNPGRIIDTVEVPVPRPREPGQFLSREFVATKRHLESLIHGQRSPAVESLPRFRRCQADEDVQ
ncbi:MAG: ABC transporter ATP-binding protein [Myxococcales bacterium]|nr:ABC transporter ATP-binding protein [Myxococcales bacterium]